ncbi:MAG: TIGR00341 family protein [Synechococcales cyanobacterium CRU_2_2]|nr:TIGR00341 family protein [Synechococcales cyanobacterium CRU_2_2]
MYEKADPNASTPNPEQNPITAPAKQARSSRRPAVVWVRHYLPALIHRPIIKVFRKLGRKWDTNSGDWAWLEQKPMPLKLLNRNLWRIAEPASSYYVMLFISGIIATLGLLAGSAAAIIGAMIVAPLMGPIVGMAFAITVGNRRLFKRSGIAVLSGSILTIATAYLICEVVGISSLNSEILQRTQPTLIDLVIGLAAGAAGAFAQTRREVAGALPGVAIAVALVPPLSVIGIGLALGSSSVALGSTLLFLTNLAGIILSGGLVFIWQEYGSLKRARRGLTASTALLALLGIPLGLSMQDLIAEEKGRSAVNQMIRSDLLTFCDSRIQGVDINSDGDRLRIRIEVAAQKDAISENQVDLVRQAIERRLDRPVELAVNVYPVQSFSSIGSKKEKVSFE